MKTFATLLLSISLFAFINKANAQDLRKSSMDLNGGISLPHMDVQGQPGFIGSVSYHYAFSQPVSAHITVMGGSISGSDEGMPYNRKFTNNITAIMVGGEVNLFALASLTNPSRIIDPYLSVEGGPLFSNIVSINDQDGLGANEYKGVDLTLGAGGGVKVYLSPVIDLNSKITFYIPNSDQIDGYSAPVAANRANDYFTTFQIGVNLKIGNTQQTHAMWASRAADDKDDRLAELRKQDREKAKNVFEDDGPGDESEIDRETNKSLPDNDQDTIGNSAPRNESKPETEDRDQLTGQPGQSNTEEENNDSALADAKQRDAEPEPAPAVDENTAGSDDTAVSHQEPNEPAGRKNIPPEPVPDEPATLPVPVPEEEREEDNTAMTPIYKTNVVLPSGEMGGHRYYVIIGSFSNQQNASEFISTSNYDGNMEIITDNSGTYYRVAAGNSNELTEAKNLRRQLRQVVDPDSWILENANY